MWVLFYVENGGGELDYLGSFPDKELCDEARDKECARRITTKTDGAVVTSSTVCQDEDRNRHAVIQTVMEKERDGYLFSGQTIVKDTHTDGWITSVHVDGTSTSGTSTRANMPRANTNTTSAGFPPDLMEDIRRAIEKRKRA